jgi:hypothetical protein
MRLGTLLRAVIPKLLEISQILRRRSVWTGKFSCVNSVKPYRNVAEGKAFIAKQERLIVESERDGHDT